MTEMKSDEKFYTSNDKSEKSAVTFNLREIHRPPDSSESYGSGNYGNWGNAKAYELDHLVMSDPYGDSLKMNSRANNADGTREKITPRIAAPWSTDGNLDKPRSREDRAAAIAKNDIAICSPEQLGLKFENQQNKGLSVGYTKESEKDASEFVKEIKEKNPNTKILTEVRYRDAEPSYLPSDSKWWLRTGDKIETGWQGKDAQDGKAPTYQKLDFTNKEFQNHLVEQARETAKTSDGIMLDWFNSTGDKGDPKIEKAREDLVTKIRQAIGPDKLIIVNANAEELPKAVNDEINGYYMECYQSTTPKEWKKIQNTLDFAEKNTRSPHINIVETWPDPGQGREELNKMRATTTLAATHAPDASSLFADRDGTTQHEHGHDWYNFWNTDIGKPTGPLVIKDGASRREYENVTAVCNPPGNKEITLNFKEPRESAATGKISKSFTLPANDGDFYKKLD